MEMNEGEERSSGILENHTNYIPENGKVDHGQISYLPHDFIADFHNSLKPKKYI